MPKRNLIWAGAMALAAVLVILLSRDGDRGGVTIIGRGDPLGEAIERIEDHYLYDVDGEALRRGAIEAVVASLDAYSTLVPESASGQFGQRIGGRAFGLGLLYRLAGGRVEVIGPLPDSPALAAGLGGGDEILAIDGNRVADLSEAQVRARLSPRPGDRQLPVQLTVLAARDEGLQQIQVTPSSYPIESVKGLYRDSHGQWVHSLGEGGLVYVRISEFLPHTKQRLLAVLRHEPSVSGLVLDLRNNPGGLLPVAIDTARAFIDDGLIAEVRYRNQPPRRHLARGGRVFPAHVPMVVLINDQTASGAELLAGALGQHRRAVLVGTRTVGKGCVQSMFDLDGGLGRLNLTTAEFRVDPNTPIVRRPGAETWGIAPHVEVFLPPVQADALALLRLRGEVVGPVSPGPSTRPTSDGAAEPDTFVERLLAIDSQLNRAVGLLRAPGLMAPLLAAPEQEPAGADAENPKPKGPQRD